VRGFFEKRIYFWNTNVFPALKSIFSANHELISKIYVAGIGDAKTGHGSAVHGGAMFLIYIIV
jgi:hypothetical protein